MSPLIHCYRVPRASVCCALVEQPYLSAFGRSIALHESMFGTICLPTRLVAPGDNPASVWSRCIGPLHVAGLGASSNFVVRSHAHDLLLCNYCGPKTKRHILVDTEKPQDSVVFLNRPASVEASWAEPSSIWCCSQSC